MTEPALQTLAQLEATNPKKAKKVKKTIGLLETQGPNYTGLESHHFHSIAGPKGEQAWESYVENNTPGAWRIFWYYGPGRGEITVFAITPHP